MARLLVLGGSPNSLLNFRGSLLQTLTRRGHEVFACSAPATHYVVTELANLGVRYTPAPIKRVGINPAEDVRLCITLVGLMRTIKPDFVLAYTAKPVIYGGIAANLAGINHFYAMVTGLGYALTGHTLKQCALGFIVRLLYRAGLFRANAVFFQNPDDLAFFRKNNLLSSASKSLQINGSGVDLSIFRPTTLPTCLVFSIVARLVVDKGLREFYSAAQSLKGKYPNVRFLVAGAIDVNPNSISKAELQQWIDEGVIEFKGWLTDVRPLLTETLVYVLPSYREGTPRSILEAMAMARPIITTDAPGCRETVIDGLNGYLVPVRDALALEKAMERFILNKALAAKMGAASLARAENMYDVNKVNAVILKTMGLM